MQCNVSFRFDDDGWFLHIILFYICLFYFCYFFLLLLLLIWKLGKKTFLICHFWILFYQLPTHTHTHTDRIVICCCSLVLESFLVLSIKIMYGNFEWNEYSRESCIRFRSCLLKLASCVTFFVILFTQLSLCHHYCVVVSFFFCHINNWITWECNIWLLSSIICDVYTFITPWSINFLGFNVLLSL